MLSFDAKFLRILKDMNMLLPDSMHPENTVYFNGATVLQVLQNCTEMELLDLYHKTCKLGKMTFPMFVLCLDWLYLIEVVTVENDMVKLCS